MPKIRRPARWHRPAVDEAIPASAVIAAAMRMQPGYVRDRAKKRQNDGWQAEAWEHYDECGPLKYIVNLAAEMMSRARMYVTMLDENGEPSESPPDNVNADLARKSVFGGPVVQKQLLYQFGIQLGVPGECFLVGEVDKTDDGEDTGRERWSVVSTDEFTEDQQGNWTIDNGNGKRQVDPETTAVIRVWKPHPRKYDEADSQVRANRRPLRILARLSMYTQALLDSRLAGPGILLLPKELTFARPGNAVADPNTGAETFLQALTEAMTNAIENPDSAEALVPIVVQGPAEHLKEARLLTMSTPLTENLTEIEQQAVKNLALGLDAPPEMLLGLADTNHWSAWQLEEATVKYVVEPLLELVCSAVTEQFLWPVFEDQGIADAREWLIWYDSTELVKRPDKSQGAQQLFGDGELSGDALRRENGFSDNDKPSPVERELRLMMALAQAIPAVAEQLAPRLLQLISDSAAGLPEPSVKGTVEIKEPEPEPAPALPAGGGGTDEPPDQQEKEDNSPPQRDEAAAIRQPAAVAALEQVALTALRTANRRNAGRNRFKLDGMAEAWHTQLPVLPSATGTLLAASLDTIGVVAARLGVDRDRLHDAMYAYLATTLVEGVEHDADRMTTYVAAAVSDGR